MVHGTKSSAVHACAPSRACRAWASDVGRVALICLKRKNWLGKICPASFAKEQKTFCWLTLGDDLFDAASLFPEGQCYQLKLLLVIGGEHVGL